MRREYRGEKKESGGEEVQRGEQKGRDDEERASVKRHNINLVNSRAYNMKFHE